MKYLLFCILISSTLTYAGDKETYADGYQKGYQDARCNGSSYCTPPTAPVAPVPRVGAEDRDAGYRAGLEKGKRK